MTLLYALVCRLLELVVLFARRDRAKELEILVLRHELSIFRRQAGRPRFEPHDRLLLAALSRVLPRRSWNAFLVRPETLLRWHRRIVARRWTSPRRRPGARRLAVRCSFLQAHGESILACDFFTVDTVWLRRLYVLVFLSIGSRRVEYLACTSNPNTAWMLQQARNLLMELDDRDRRASFLIHDRDTKFPRAFDSLMASEEIKVIRTPVQAPNANAHMERWVGSVRRECLDRLLIVGRRQLEHVLRVYVRHYNRRRPHRALDLKPPESSARSPVPAESKPHALQVSRRDLLGGLIHQYELAAAA